jgi:hypothetical protein
MTVLWIAAIGFLAKLAVDVLKFEPVAAVIGKIPDSVKPWIALALGGIGMAVTLLVSNKDVLANIQQVLAAATAAIAVHELHASVSGATAKTQLAKAQAKTSVKPL